MTTEREGLTNVTEATPGPVRLVVGQRYTCPHGDVPHAGVLDQLVCEETSHDGLPGQARAVLQCRDRLGLVNHNVDAIRVRELT